MVTTKLNLSMTEPSVRQIYAKQGDTGRVLDISLDQTPEDGTLRILRPDGVEVTSEAVTGGEVESGSTFESLTEADVTELSVGIEPVQDLNGYDHPWVGGAGKNILPPFSSFTENGIIATVANDGTITLNGTATANVNKQVTVNAPAGDYCLSLNNDVAVGTSASTTVYFYAVDGGGSWVMNPLCNVRNAFGRGTSANGITVVRMTINSGVTLNNFVIKPQLELGSTATAWQPYSNICPISGRTSATVTRTGKNLLPPMSEDETINGVVWHVNEDNSISISGTASGNSIEDFGRGHLTLKPGTYTTNRAKDGVTCAIWENSSPARLIDANGGTFVLTQDTPIFIRFYVPSGNTVNTTIYPQLELGSTATAYEPYQGSTYTTSLGQTVYGGTLDMVTGVLNVTYGYKDIDDFATLTSVTSAGGLYFADIAGTYTENAPSVCSMLEQIAANRAWSSTTECYAIEARKIRVYTTETTLANFKTKFAQLQIAYSLAEPVTYQLTPQQIKTLVGTNNVWASSGQIVNIKFTYGGLLSELPSDATSVVGKCYCDVEQDGVSSMPFTLNVKKNERQ